ncbi:MAG: energy transducer TonB [Thermodesulfobacteriota bacterium]
MKLIRKNPLENSKSHKRRRKTIIPFILLSILFHLILAMLYLLFYPLQQQAQKPKDQPKFIEISELPVPKDKETEPPKEVKRFAERSHQTPKEKTRDDLTKRGSISTPAQPKQPRTSTKPKETKTVKEKPKEKVAEKSRELAAIPKELEKDSEIPRKEQKREKLDEITKEQLFSSVPKQFSQQRQASQEFLGSRNAEKNEDTVDLNTTEYRYLSYFLKLKRQIEGVWNYPEISRIKGEQGELFLIFTIRKDGFLEDVKLLDSSGYVRLDDEAVRAIRVASPFSPFPESWSLERLNIRATFRYQISYGWTIR